MKTIKTIKALRTLTAATLLGACALAQAQTKWDLPAAYPATNFHSVNLQAFADDVDKATGGKLKITVHAGASLFKAPEIKRAVQGGQAQIGEMLMSAYQNEWIIFGADGVPFLADSYDEAARAVEGAEARGRQEARRAGPDGAVHRAVAAAGHLHQEGRRQRGRSQGHQVARLQPGHFTHRRVGGRTARDGAGGRVLAGAGHRRGREHHDVRRDWRGQQALRAPEVLLRHAGLAAEERGHRQQDGLRRARQGDAGRRAESRRRCRDARLGGQQEGQRRNARQAQGQRHAGAAALAPTQGRHGQGGRDDAQGVG